MTRALVAALLLAGAAQVQAIRERAYPPSSDDRDTLYLQSGTAIRRMTPSLNALAADVYWIRAIQHYGGTKRRLTASAGATPVTAPTLMLAEETTEYSLLYPLLDITTSLDPRFKIAYRFGAVFLAEPFPNGAGRPDLAQALLEKGLRAQPDKWEYMEDIGFVNYWYRQDYQAAAAWFEKASQMTGAPWWLKSLAATTLIQGGDRQSSRVMWQAIRESAEVDWLRHDAERRLAQLNALDAIDQLQHRLDEFTKAQGRPPAAWSDLVRARLIPGIPLDPSGTPFDLIDGRVRLSSKSSLSPLPEGSAVVRPSA